MIVFWTIRKGLEWIFFILLNCWEITSRKGLLFHSLLWGQKKKIQESFQKFIKLSKCLQDSKLIFISFMKDLCRVNLMHKYFNSHENSTVVWRIYAFYYCILILQLWGLFSHNWLNEPRWCHTPLERGEQGLSNKVWHEFGDFLYNTSGTKRV